MFNILSLLNKKNISLIFYVNLLLCVGMVWAYLNNRMLWAYTDLLNASKTNCMHFNRLLTAPSCPNSITTLDSSDLRVCGQQ